jgi:hypothetical protein
LRSRLQNRERAVPRYYFHVRDGQLMRDEFGQELPDGEAAARLARRVAAQLAENRKHRSATILVSDGVQTLFELAVADLVPAQAAPRK